MRTNLICFCILLIGSSAYSQKQNNIWYFGEFAGLSFNENPPAALRDGQLNTNEGCASIADEEGNLLFYTDGIKVWDREHDIMPNGNNLNGNPSSTQSGIIIPWPNNDNVYYIFTVGFQGGSFSYSVVDLTLNNGMGDVLAGQKNSILLGPVTEKVTAILHHDQQSYWVITHAWESDEFYAYHVTENGIEDNPVISRVGSVHQGGDVGRQPNLNTLGYMKVSPDGSKLALAVSQDGFVEVFDFDDASGIVANPQRLDYPGLNPYGIEFSPDSRLLYVGAYPKDDITGEGKLYQYALNNLLNSEFVLSSPSRYPIGALQLASDHKIYIARAGGLFLSAINNSNLVGDAAQYQEFGRGLAFRNSNFGLPTFVQSVLNVELEFTYTINCSGDSTFFILEDAEEFENVQWDFGDPASSEENTSSEINPRHLFSSPGTYNVTVTVDRRGVTFSETKEVEILPASLVNLGNDTTLQYQQTLLLDVSQENATYLWQDGSTTSSFTVSAPGTYSVQLTDENGCTTSDEIEVIYEHSLNFDLGQDQSLCEGENVILDATVEGASYLWQDGSANPTLEANESGIYWVDVTDAFGQQMIRDSVTLDFISLVAPQVEDQTLCEAGTIELSVQDPDPNITYRWYNNADTTLLVGEGNSISTDVSAEDTSFFIIAGLGDCRSKINEVKVMIDNLDLSSSPDQNINEGESVQLQASGADTYLWSPAEGLSDPSIPNPVANPTSTTTYTLTASNAAGCQVQTTVTVTVLEVEEPVIDPVDPDTTAFPSLPGEPNVDPDADTESLHIPNVFTPNDDGFNDSWEIRHLERYPEAVLKVYNRWGVEVYQNRAGSQAWDGSFQSKILPADVYFYILKLNDPPGRSLSGNVTIIR